MKTFPTGIESAYIEIKDIAQEIDVLNNQLIHDPDRLAQVNDRLNLLYSLEKKHRVIHSCRTDCTSGSTERKN